MIEENHVLIKALNMFGRVPEMWELLEEIERLNNIINELEKYINEEYVYDDNGMKIFDVSELQDKLQELKGSDKE